MYVFVIFSNRNLFSVVVTKESEQVVTIIVFYLLEVACDNGAEIYLDSVCDDKNR